MLEQQLYESSKIRKERIYLVEDLEKFSGVALYSGNESKEYDKYIDETIRFDNHVPFGEHLNYEVWLKLKGKKEGRNFELTNVHIPLDFPTIKNGS